MELQCLCVYVLRSTKSINVPTAICCCCFGNLLNECWLQQARLYQTISKWFHVLVLECTLRVVIFNGLLWVRYLYAQIPIIPSKWNDENWKKKRVKSGSYTEDKQKCSCWSCWVIQRINIHLISFLSLLVRQQWAIITHRKTKKMSLR